MMVSAQTYLRRQHRQFRQWTQLPTVRPALEILRCSAGGLLLSAAGLGGSPQPLAMGLCCAVTGWQSAAVCLGSILGYSLFWDGPGVQGILWSVVGFSMALFIRKHPLCKEMPLLIPAMAAFFVSALGLTFQVLGMDLSAFWIYVLRVAVAWGSVMLFQRRVQLGDPLSRWGCGCLLVLSLARISPVAWLNPGYIACGYLSAGQSFPQAVLAGLGMDLARISLTPMTAVVCLCCLLRLLPWKHPVFQCLGTCVIYLGISALRGSWDLTPLPTLVLGRCLGLLLPAKDTPTPRKGITGHAQVQLELTAGVMAETRQLLMETISAPIDESALLEKAAFQACGNCVLRGECRERENLSIYHLHHPLDFACRKPGRILGELRRGREQLLSLRRERERYQEYRWAVVQQYQFLGDYLQDLADNLPRREIRPKTRYRIQVSARSRGKTLSNGDSCLAFPGTQCQYYIVLCDGMGTGMGAAQAGHSTALLLKKMLTAGLTAEQAFRSINSILTLRGQAGLVTLDLAEVFLDSGKTRLYKWGAASSWLLRGESLERIGYSTAPPGIRVSDAPSDAFSLSLKHGETLVLLSDGVDIHEAILRGKVCWDLPTGELAAAILSFSRSHSEDDATAAVLRLHRLPETTGA